MESNGKTKHGVERKKEAWSRTGNRIRIGADSRAFAAGMLRDKGPTLRPMYDEDTVVKGNVKGGTVRQISSCFSGILSYINS